ELTVAIRVTLRPVLIPSSLHGECLARAVRMVRREFSSTPRRWLSPRRRAGSRGLLFARRLDQAIVRHTGAEARGATAEDRGPRVEVRPAAARSRSGGAGSRAEAQSGRAT